MTSMTSMMRLSRLADVEAAQVVCATPSELEVTVPLGDSVSDSLEPGHIPGSHSEVFLCPHHLLLVLLQPPPPGLLGLPGHSVLLSEALAPHQAVAAGEAAALLDFLPALGQRHWGRHPESWRVSVTETR